MNYTIFDKGGKQHEAIGVSNLATWAYQNGPALRSYFHLDDVGFG
jgi:hypothetical protein